MKAINFDMDGTLANFYEVNGWLEDIINENARPYIEAKPLFDFSILAKQLNRLQAQGYEINIISWLAKNGSAEFNQKVTIAKIEWLEKYLPSVKFNKITIVEYGTPKSQCGDGILFDDEIGNRNEWKGIAYEANNILEILKEIY